MQQKIFFKNSNGVKLCGVLSDPKDNKNNLIVIICHGFSNNKDGDFYVMLSDEINKKNVSTFRFDYFGHGESEGNFEDITVTEGIDDILCSYSLLKKEGYTNIALFGSSYGGNTSLFAATKIKDLRFLMLRAPVSDYLEVERIRGGEERLKKWKEDGIRLYRERDGKKLFLKYAFYEDIKKYDGYKAGEKINIPVLLMHGDQDEVIPLAQSIKLSKIIKNCKFYIMKGATHIIKHDKEQVKSHIKKIVDYITEHAKVKK
jgi:hypothetical protein